MGIPQERKGSEGSEGWCMIDDVFFSVLVSYICFLFTTIWGR